MISSLASSRSSVLIGTTRLHRESGCGGVAFACIRERRLAFPTGCVLLRLPQAHETAACSLMMARWRRQSVVVRAANARSRLEQRAHDR